MFSPHQVPVQTVGDGDWNAKRGSEPNTTHKRQTRCGSLCSANKRGIISYRCDGGKCVAVAILHMLNPHTIRIFLTECLLLKQMQPSQIFKVAKYPVDKTTRTECGWDFCRLGCVCASLQYSKKVPLHCQRPECMFGCACFKRKITKQLITAEDEAQGQPVYCKSKLF